MIECNGDQHYEYGKGFFFWSKKLFRLQQKRDKIKKKYARKNHLYIEIHERNKYLINKLPLIITKMIKNKHNAKQEVIK